MEEWKEYRLGDVAIIKGGKRLPKGIELISNPNTHPYIRISDMYVNKTMELTSSYRYVDNNTFNKIKNYIVNSGDVILAIVGNTIGLVAVIGKSLNNANLTENCVKIIANKEVSQEYIYYYLTSIYGQNKIKKGIVGAAQPKLPIKNIISITISAPSKELQERTTNILSSLDDKIELNRRINENLEQQAQALFKSWFVDFEPFKNGKFVDSELGMIPEGWKVCELGNLCDSISITHPCKKGELIFLNTGDIENGSVLTNKYMNIKDMPGQAKKSIKENDILYSEIRPINRHYAFVNFPAHEYIVSTKLMVIRAINEKLSIRLYQYLTSDDIINELQHEAESRSGTFPQIRFENIKKLKILIGPNNIENQYTEFIGNIYKMIFQYRKEIIKLEHLRDTLLPKLMSGELKINDFNN